ncbi:BTAD domain-containing putative transcriptional regulator [Rhodococcoides kyotonense]|uniref:Transcriptional regulatory protein, C terminal n=1 Tax=Rhodococcoides kyotonense TaxID=398843 RepID=A0A239G4M3_9NOCA|nr:BTAD domain-containing putative transcriptional regulator [Rhodococcus kyotonensis]SNS63443.1 Transcriptional regulatory protein, C terminal [Rhodococcus kyotonensis]
MTSQSVSISLFGNTRATVDGRPVDLGSRGQRAVLARLVAAGPRIVSTDELIEDLWAGAPPPSALGALQVNVSNLRRVLEPGRAPRSRATVLVSAPPGYALQLPPDAVDVWRFERLLVDASRAVDTRTRTEILTEALDMWQAMPYAEVADVSWAKTVADRALEQRRAAFEECARALLDLGEPAQVVVDMERLVRHVPHREEGVRLLALALYRSGRQAEALAALRACRTYLADELGIDPGPALRDIETDILGHSPALSGRESALPVPLPATESLAAPEEPADVDGRPEDLRALLAVAERSGTGRFAVVWISGEAGEGKSTLAGRLSRALSRTGWSVGWGQCPEVDGAPPGWAWTEVLTALADVRPIDERIRARLAPVLDGDNTEDASGGPFWLGKSASEYLHELGTDAPILLVLDDVHRADALTLGMLRQIANDSRGQRILLVATYRASEVTDDLTATWATMTDVDSTWMPLRGVDRARTAELAAHFGLADPTAAVVDLLVERTGGNPLFLRELARLIASEGTAAAKEGVPLGVSDVLRRRLSRLPDRTLVTLRSAAVLGRDVDLDLLAAFTGVDEDRMLDDLEPAVLAGLLSEPGADRLRFTHALIRDTLYFDLPRLRRTRAHGAALRVLEHSAPDDLAALAHHAALGATAATARDAVAHIVAAARRAESLSSHTDALQLWNSAVQTLNSASGSTDRERLDLLVPLVGSLARAGNTVDARGRRQQAIDLAIAVGDRTALVDAITAWTAPVIWHIRDSAPDAGILDPIASLLQDDSLPDSDRALVLVAKFFELEGLDDAAAVSSAQEALTLAESVGEPRILCAALNAFGYLAYGPDFPSERRPRAQQLMSIAADHGFTEYEALAHYQLFLACNSDVDLLAARTHVGAAVRLASGSALTQLLGVLNIYGALVDVLAGRYENALATYSAISATMNEQSEWHGDESGAMGRLSVAVATGTFTDVVPTLADLDENLPVVMRNALVLALAENDEMEAARRLWRVTEPHARDYLWRGMTAMRARAAVHMQDDDVCRECYRQLLPFAGTLAGVDSGSLFAGIVDDVLADLASALGDIDAEKRHRRGADAVRTRVATQLSAPGWMQLTYRSP